MYKLSQQVKTSALDDSSCAVTALPLCAWLISGCEHCCFPLVIMCNGLFLGLGLIDHVLCFELVVLVSQLHG